MATEAGEHFSVLISDAVRRAVAADEAMTIADAVLAVRADDLDVFLHASFDGDDSRDPLTIALGASPGAASGVVVFTAEEAIDLEEAGTDVILVRNETTPDDVLGMQAAKGILTTRGGITSHAAVVARGWGIPAVVGAGEIVIDDDGMHIGDVLITSGTEISIDGRTGEVYLGGSTVVSSAAPPELDVLMAWADQIRTGVPEPVGVRANADNAEDAAHARRMGAEGIGLCRTEHMFLADDRLPLVRRLILTDDPNEERAALDDLEVAQQADFTEILEVMDGLPVTVRLLDPPLHEFLPNLERLVVAEALDELDDDGRVELAAVRRLHEVNPMIGTRGVRLGVVKPGLYAMQVRALFRAVAAEVAAGRQPDVEVMVPLVVDPAEMRLARTWVDSAIADVGRAGSVKVGAMLETPRAALLAGELAQVSEFFSFGTNDLTQMVYAFSRDDVGSKLIPEYLEAGILQDDPFASLDQMGVGRLIRFACDNARAANPQIKIGVCGEQAGDPDSAKFLVDCGLDYVSCSPYRVVIARLAVAQGLLASGRVSEELLGRIAAATQPPANTETSGDAVAEPAGTSEIARPEPSGSTLSSASEASDDEEFLVLHAMRIKGFAGPEILAELSGVQLDRVEQRLAAMADTGMCRHLPARGFWQLLPPGKDRHAVLLAAAQAAAGELRDPYQRFLDLNVAFKELCNRWQMRGEETNDHTDAAYDGERLNELDQLHQQSTEPLGAFAAAMPRLSLYRQRLDASLSRLRGGETKMFTGVMCNSYHDVWMELHEDLIQLLGVDRHEEGSY